MKNSNDTIWNRTSYLPSCSTAAPHTGMVQCVLPQIRSPFTRLLIPMHAKRTIPYLYTQPSSRRGTLRFETCRRHQKILNINQNSAFCWFILCNYVTTHSAKDVKFGSIHLPQQQVRSRNLRSFSIHDYCHSVGINLSLIQIFFSAMNLIVAPCIS